MRFLFAELVWRSFERVLRPEAFTAVKAGTGLTHLTQWTWLGDAAGWFDFSYLFAPDFVPFLKVAMLVCLLVYVAGLLKPVVTPAVTLVHIAAFSMFNSQGYTHHGYQIISLILLAQSIVYVLPWAMRLFRKELRLREGVGIEDLAVFYSQLVIAACYVLPALSKLLKSGFEWVLKSPGMLATQLVKTHEQAYYNVLDPVFREKAETSIQWVLDNPGMVQLMMGSALALEFFAFLALANRWMALLIGGSLIVMHRCIEPLMELAFPTNEFCIWVYLVNIPFWTMVLFKIYQGKKKDV